MKPTGTPINLGTIVFPGIYYLYNGDFLVYIGKGENVIERILARKREGRFFFDGYTISQVPPKNLDRVYAEELLKYNPPANFDYPAPVTSYRTMEQLKAELGMGAVAIKKLIKEHGAEPIVYNNAVYYNIEDLK